MSRVGGRRSKFEELRALRKAGKKAFDTYEVEDADKLYEEVDENQYKKIVRERLNEDDFVVDDNGEGYADDGREEWDRVQVYETDSEDDRIIRTKGRKSKKAREDDQAKRDANNRGIAEYLKGAAKAQPKTKVIKTEEDEQFLDKLLNEVDANIPAALPRIPRKKRTADQRSRGRGLSPAPVAKKVKFSDSQAPPTPAADYGNNDMGAVDDNDDSFIVSSHQHSDPVPASDDLPMSDALPSSPTVRVANRKAAPAPAEIKKEEDDEDDEDGLMEVAHAGAVTAASVNLAAARPVKKTPKAVPYPSPASSSPTRPAVAVDETIDASAWTSLNRKLNVMSSPQTEAPSPGGGFGKVDQADAVEEDGSLNFFWTDYTEVNGSLCLFGKVLNKKTKKHVSSFVKIDNIQRTLYFLPRKTRRVGGQDTDEEVGMNEVYLEVDGLMTKMRVEQHRTKTCTRKYAFELPGIPKEGQYLKLLYPYTKPELGQPCGETFSHVFGANTALFEQFVLWKNIMGPCWLKIENPDFGSVKNASHCKVEVQIDSPDTVSTLNEANAPDVPPLTLMSLAMRMVYDPKTKKQEILAISGRIYENVTLSDTTPADQLPSRTFTIIRPHGTAFPIGFEALTRDASRHRGLVKTVKREAEILSFFLAQVAMADPDVLIGHQLEGVDYSVLLNRLHENKTPQWSRLGRLRRTTWPSSLSRAGGNVFAERQMISGRLLCDLANDAGRSTMFKCQSWTLTEMCSLYLTGPGQSQNQRRDIDNDVALASWARSKEGLLDYVAHIEADTYFIAALALRVQILPLTKVLTNLAGNSWARTLTGTRAERNEYILLHEFYRNKYIVPDKQTFRGRAKADDEGAENEGGAGAGKKKDKYKGGLVFEPERGLYDKFVLVMDFNSLYPSIIQEFNICFTTVERSSLPSEDEDAIPEVPSEQSQGVLPRLIATLVSRRRQVKSLMKDKTATQEQLATWDIKQLALKLTANSMYGCLGYTRSRFYARPLAVLVTYKGREILRSTKDLAESKALQVIYGDTDSVMINANVDNVADALRVGQEFKRAVNERYRLLEIDIDNIFRRILLQAKKKYAAINMTDAGNGVYTEKMEVKGLDMRRREYCALSKEMSTRILNEILSGHEAEVTMTHIHAYLREMAEKMRSGNTNAKEGGIPLAKYIIYTQLGKDPGDYPNADTMPQVQVALREQARGKMVRRGDVVSYIIAQGEGVAASDPAPKRAYSPGDLQKKDAGLVPDVEWYIGKQIFPPVERLCANIVGTSTAQLAENLGLDVKRYAAAHGGSGGGHHGADANGDGIDIHPLESQIPDAVRFRDCARLQLRCRKCKATGVFAGLGNKPEEEETKETEEAGQKSPAVTVTPAGVACGQCGAVLSTLSVVAQVEHAVRVATARYYEGWLVCDDPQCGQRTRQMSVYGARCLGPKGLARDCLGRMRYAVGERDIYNQLVYLAGLFDVDKAQAAAKAAASTSSSDASKLSDEERERVLALAEHNRVRFGTVKGVVERYLDKCGRRWVAMDTLFAKLGFAATSMAK